MGAHFLCRFFGHKFDTWKYVDSNSCEQLRTCKRDSFTEKQVSHVFSSWEYVAPGSCKQIHVCARCKEKEERILHVWSSWEAENAEFHIRTCSRDAVVERDAHVFSYTSETCSDCGATGFITRIGGYGNNPIEYNDECSSCGGNGRISSRSSCTVCYLQ